MYGPAGIGVQYAQFMSVSVSQPRIALSIYDRKTTCLIWRYTLEIHKRSLMPRCLL